VLVVKKSLCKNEAQFDFLKLNDGQNVAGRILDVTGVAGFEECKDKVSGLSSSL
jgi:hypothetical protein